jgi:hypothetical protein
MQKLNQTIEEAVTGVVEVFISEDETFSIYNITTSLRDLLNQGWIEISGLQRAIKPVDLEDDSSERVETQELPHSLVKDTFLNLFNNHKLKCEEVGRGKFTTYGPIVWIAAPATPATPVHPTQTISKNSTSIQKSVDDLTDQIERYLKTKGQATLKQIQSRLKEKGITCSDLEKTLTKLDGIVLDLAPVVSKIIAKIK